MSSARRVPANVVMPGRSFQSTVMVNDDFAQETVNVGALLLSYAKQCLRKMPARRVPIRILWSEPYEANDLHSWSRGFRRYAIVAHIEGAEVVG